MKKLTAFTVAISAIVDATTSQPPSCPLAPTLDMDVFYSQMLVSEIYTSFSQSELIKDECFSLLATKFQNTIGNDAVYKTALVDGLCTVPTGGLTVAVPVGSSFSGARFDVDDGRGIRLDDYLVSSDVTERLNGILSLLAKQPLDLAQANLRMYYLHTDILQRSACTNLDSRVFKKLVEQIHYRLVGSGADDLGSINSSLSILARHATELQMAANFLAHPAEPKFMIAAAAAMVIPIVVEVGCWCIAQCIRYYRSRTSTTTTTTTTTTGPSTIAAWIIEGQRRQILQFVSVANADLDDIMITIGSVTDMNYETTLSSLRKSLLVKVLRITQGIVSNGAGGISGPSSSFDPSSTLEFSQRMTELLSSTHSPSEWQAARTEILTTLRNLRQQLNAVSTV